ncbi:MAG: hypothetical protein CMF62_03405 [Magnetococcales bacterium]|nr:hypothetical protein [Magnetococcales bacterium]
MSTEKLDKLKFIEEQVKDSVITQYAPKVDTSLPKYFVTFPYPYMNGRLHQGHAYTISKAEFIARRKIIQGYNVLFPFGFHGTGMPIVASSFKLKKNLEEGDYSKKSQANILINMGVPKESLEKFIDPYYWIEYFPALAKIDLLKFGVSCDFTRSFITTEINPYYDSFVKWQFEILKQKGKLKFGKKIVIYSPQLEQPCAADDRSIGEDVEIQTYTLLEFKLVGLVENILIATSKPELSYGASNLWINPNENFVKFKYEDNIYVASEHCFENLKYQYMKTAEIININIHGSSLLYKEVDMYSNNVVILPLSSVKLNRGSGFMLSVPTINISDYLNYTSQYDESKLKPFFSYNDDYNIAKTITNEYNLKKKDIEKIKNYQEQIDEMIVLSKNYDTLKREFIKTHKYSEPQSMVISRSGDKCVCALIDQWYIEYGDKLWTEKINNFLLEFETYDEGVKRRFEDTSEWIGSWGCTRSSGLGTKFFDSDFLIDSLSDSTIYMAYYTIANRITQIDSKNLNSDVWNYIFFKDYPDFDHPNISLLKELREEFHYWYPIDIRVSGKDLIPNHLTMSLYTHQAIWEDPKMMPSSYYCNGHITLNSKKMSKSTGNFMTLEDSINKYSADVTRLSLALSGEGQVDANFDDSITQSLLEKLYIESVWFDSMNEKLKDVEIIIQYDNFYDKVFFNKIQLILKNYNADMEQMKFARAVTNSFYRMINARNQYISKEGDNMHLFRYFVETFLSINYPFCVHFVEYYKKLYELETLEDPIIYEPDLKLLNRSEKFEDFIHNFHVTYSKSKVKNKDIQITIYNNHHPIRTEILELIKEKIKGENILENLTNSEIKKSIMNSVDKKHRKVAGGMLKEIKKGIDIHGICYIDFMLDIDPNEKNLVEDILPKIINKKISTNERENGLEPIITIKVEEYPKSWTIGPFNPLIKIIENIKDY